MHLHPELVVEDIEVLLVRIYDTNETVVKWYGLVTDFIWDGLEDNDDNVKGRLVLYSIHTLQEDVGVRNKVVVAWHIYIVVPSSWLDRMNVSCYGHGATL